ncbi:right-handed parallel beta-helix repeat-containing protein, partial [Nonomuraea sp. NPDC003201]
VCAAAAPALSGGANRLLAEPVKLIKLYLCADFSASQARLPAGCDWFGASGLGKVETQLALGGSAVLGLLLGLFWWRSRRGARRHGGDGRSGNGVAPAVTAIVRRRHRLVVAGSVAGAAGLVLDVLAAAVDSTSQAGAALLLMGAWWLCLGAALRGRRPAFGLFTIVVGVLACADAFDRLVYLIPVVPLGPGWIRGLLTGLWVLCAVVVLAPRRRGTARETPAEAEVSA